MVKTITSQGILSAEEIDQLSKESFSAISSIYHDAVPQSERQDYLRNNFTQVKLEEYKQAFLSLNWPYIYTLNIDDGIERNSVFDTVVYSNREVRKSIFDENRCVIKLHGDISEMLTYDDAVSEIFDQKQYVLSIQKNESLLSRLTHDFQYQNVLFVGCSLDDEIDLMSASNAVNSIGQARYYCTATTPSTIEKFKLKKYGITHCIIFNSYTDIYEFIYDAAREAEQICPSEIEQFITHSFHNSGNDFQTNKPYLFYGKSLINKDRTITVPHFFIKREITASIIDNIDNHALQFIRGNSCSGKTYIALDVAMQIRDRDVFIFESKDSLSDVALNALLERKNCLIIADSGSLNILQIEHIIRIHRDLSVKKIHIIVITNQNNRDLINLIRLLEYNEEIDKNIFPQTVVNNRFTIEEIKLLNPLLVESTLGVFTENKTIVDNIIEASNALLVQNKFSRIAPHFSDKRMIASLIALAIEKKIYSTQMIDYDIADELFNQYRATDPLIEQDNTLGFETTASNNALFKYVVNAEYWLDGQLDTFSRRPQNHALIADAFRHIISRIVIIYGKPDLSHGEKYAQYKPYILFDNINRIFQSQGLTVARRIYENLNDVLASDPHYMHQRAKCLIKSAKFEKDSCEKMDLLAKAYRDSSVAFAAFKKTL